MTRAALREGATRRRCALRALALAAILLAPCARAAVYVCDEDGGKVFRDRPCPAQEAPAAPPKRAGMPPLPANATAVFPVFSQVVAFTLPRGWTMGHESAKPPTFIAEFVPPGQRIDAWTELVTVQGFQDAAGRVEFAPASFLAGLATRLQKYCPSELSYQSLGPTQVDSYPAHAAIIGCANVRVAGGNARVGRSEIAYYLAVRGEKDLYLIHRAVRGAPFDPSRPPITAKNAPALMQALQPIKLCGSSESRDDCVRRAAR